MQVNGKLLQTDKKYSNLKMGQKEKINKWINEEIRRYYNENGVLPTKESFSVVINKVYERIEAAQIWIPFDEIYKRFYGKGNSLCNKVYGQIQKEERSLAKAAVHIEPLSLSFSICKVQDYSGVDLSQEFCFIGRTDQENSLVCPTEAVPANIIDQDNGWKAFRIKGMLEFSLIGILSGISMVLAGKAIGIFVVSTFNTDYVLVKAVDFDKAIKALEHAGYSIEK